MKQQWVTSVLALAFSMGTLVMAQAQPDPNVAGKKGNPEDNMAEAMRRGQEEGLRIARMNPQQRREAMQQMMQQILKMSLTQARFFDENLQETILKFVAEQETSRHAVRVAAHKVHTALMQANPVPVATMQTYINDYLGAVEDARVDREAAIQGLDQKIGFSKDPRLKAWLVLNGLIEEGAWYTGNISMIGSMSAAAFIEIDAAPRVAPQAGAVPKAVPQAGAAAK